MEGSGAGPVFVTNVSRCGYTVRYAAGSAKLPHNVLFSCFLRRGLILSSFTSNSFGFGAARIRIRNDFRFRIHNTKEFIRFLHKGDFFPSRIRIKEFKYPDFLPIPHPVSGSATLYTERTLRDAVYRFHILIFSFLQGKVSAAP
jgi:hypothetical protein